MSEEKSYNRKNVNNIKKMLFILFLIMFAVPVIFCMYLLLRMNSLERKIDRLNDSMQQSKGNIELPDETTEDLAALDYSAYDNLGKSDLGENQNLGQADGVATATDAEATNEEAASEEASGSMTKTFSNGKKVYLTFDDGPSTHTGELLRILKENDVKATFFCVYNPDTSTWPAYKQIVEEGHTLGMHSYTHVYGEIYADLDSFKEDVTAIHDFLYEQTGVDSIYYRFPGGSSNTVSAVSMQALIEYLGSEGITYYDWNALSGDAVDGTLTKEVLNETVMGYVRSNEGDSIVLLHDLEKNPATIEGLQDLITMLKTEGYEICPIDSDTIPIQHVKAKKPERE